MSGSPCHAPISAKWPTHADPRLDAIVNRLECTGPLGWRNIMKYATAGECVRTYAQLCTAFRPGAREKSNVFFVRHRKVMAFLSPEERVRVFSLVSKDAGRGAAALKRAAKFWPWAHLVLADGSIALNRLKAASIRFPALEDVMVCLGDAISDDQRFTDASRAPILAKLCTFTFITKLELVGNDITVVPDAIGELTNLKELGLACNKIATLPASIGRLTALERLCLQSNVLRTLPDAIGTLTNLKSLVLEENQLVGLPDAIGALTKLVYLDLTNNNNLTTVPDWIDSLTGLEALYLCGNKLTALPDSIVALTNLKELGLGCNQLTTLPSSIGSLTGLEGLYLNENQLTTLPEWIGQLTGLKALYLYHNQLTALPESIVALTNLTLMYLDENPPLIRSAQSAAVQAWLQELEDSPTCDTHLRL